MSYDEAYIKVFHTSKNIDEFKTKYLELQQKYLVDFVGGKIKCNHRKIK